MLFSLLSLNSLYSLRVLLQGVIFKDQINALDCESFFQKSRPGLAIP